MKIQNNIKQTLARPESIVMIQQILKSQSHLPRTKIAEYVCEHFRFHNALGKPQTGNCMQALRDLEQVHDFVLPAPRRFTGKRNRSVKRLGQAVDLPISVPAKACDVLGLHLIQVSNDHESLIWNELMMREHPRKAALMAGAQLRYLIASDHGWLGGFGFAASALTLKDRDQWIAWDHSIRKQHQFRVVNMSRFLIRPSVHCRNLASHCMGMALRRVACDFEARYGYQPWLLESLVDESVYSGTCYKASNWIRVGQTQGRGRNDSAHKKLETIKGIYVYPLVRNFRQRMGVTEPSLLSLAVDDGIEHTIWAQNEFGGADLGDKRLGKRLVEVARIQAEKPMRSFCGAAEGDQAVVKGYYRMIEQPAESAVTMEAILEPHRQRTIGRMRHEKIVLSIQDGTDLNFNSLAQCEGLGAIGKNQTGALSNGLHLHSTFVVNTDGLPLGVLRADCDAPQAKNEHSSPQDKKTSHWIEATHDCSTLAKILPDTRQVCVMDREGDFFELFEQRRHKRVDLLVRAKHNRKTAGKSKLFDAIRKSPARGQLSIAVPRQSARPKLSKQKAHTKRDQRTAIVEMHYQAIEMCAPVTAAHKGKASIQLWMVHIREQSPPHGEKGVEWFLLTTWPITSMEQAEECVCWYKLRWRIEDWHRVLKSGCKVGALAYKSATRLKRGIAINMVIGWRIMLMTLLGREYPNLPAEILFSDTEIKVLKAYALKKTVLSPLCLVMQHV